MGNSSVDQGRSGAYRGTRGGLFFCQRVENPNFCFSFLVLIRFGWSGWIGCMSCTGPTFLAGILIFSADSTVHYRVFPLHAGLTPRTLQPANSAVAYGLPCLSDPSFLSRPCLCAPAGLANSAQTALSSLAGLQGRRRTRFFKGKI